MKTTDKSNTPKVFILDVDGVLSTGHFIYSADGKIMKIFGPDDHDALRILASKIKIQFVTGDRTGFEISRKRIVEDMKFDLEIVSTLERAEWIDRTFGLQNSIYMGDGFFDHLVMRRICYSIAPKNADANAKSVANFVTVRGAGDRAVSEACVHILNKFFGGFDPFAPLPPNITLSGSWKA